MQDGKFRSDIEKIVYITIVVVVKYWNRHPENFLGSPSLEVFNTQLPSPEQPALFWAEVGPEASTDPFQPILLHESKEFRSP